MRLSEEQHDLVTDALYEMARQIGQVAESCAKAATTDVMPLRQDAWTQAAEEAEAQADRIRDLADLVADAETVTLRPHDDGAGVDQDPLSVETDFAVAPGEYLGEYLEDNGLSVEEFLDATSLEADLADSSIRGAVPLADAIAGRLALADAGNDELVAQCEQ